MFFDIFKTIDVRVHKYITDPHPLPKMDIAQILRGPTVQKNGSVKAGGYKPLKDGGEVIYIFRCQCQMRHQPKNVKWPAISLFMKSLGLDIYKTSPPSATKVAG